MRRLEACAFDNFATDDLVELDDCDEPWSPLLSIPNEGDGTHLMVRGPLERGAVIDDVLTSESRGALPDLRREVHITYRTQRAARNPDRMCAHISDARRRSTRPTLTMQP